MKKNNKCNVVDSLTEYHNNIDAGKFSIKKLFIFLYKILRFFWILLVFAYNVIWFVIVTAIYWILGKNCRDCIYIKKDKWKETKWCSIYHIKYNRRCRDYKVVESINLDKTPGHLKYDNLCQKGE